jgi:hypothetical protein
VNCAPSGWLEHLDLVLARQPFSTTSSRNKRPTITHRLSGDRGFPVRAFSTPLQDLQLLQTSNGIRTGRCGFDLPINIKKLSVLSNVKRPALRDCASFVHHTVGLGDFLTWIAEDRIVNTKRFSESLVLFRGICAGGKVGDIGILERFAILTE